MAVGVGMAVARSAARIPPRSIAARPTWRDTWLRTLWLRSWPIVAKCSWPTPFDDERICELVRDLFPLTPSGIIKYLDLRRPIFRKTAAGGHFGRNDPDFTWESTNRAKELAAAAKGAVATAG